MEEPRGTRPLEPKIMKKWDKFLEWLYKEKHLARHCGTPDYQSIKDWEEFHKRL